MNSVENKLREALDERAEQTAVDTNDLWYATYRRIQQHQTRRGNRLRLLVPAVGVGALAVGATVAVPAWLNSNAPHDTQLTPATTRTTAPRPSATPTSRPTPVPTLATPSTPAAKGQYTFHDAPKSVIERIVQANGLDAGEVVPVDYVRAPEGEWVLWASNQPWDDSPQPAKPFGMGWATTKVDDFGGGGTSGKPGVPTSDPLGGPVNKWLTTSHLLDYPYYGGDGLTSGAGLQFAAGQALPSVARVTGVDLQGREHEAKLVGKAEGWPTQQYFIVVQKWVQIRTYKAYDANGTLLGSVTSEDFWDDWTN